MIRVGARGNPAVRGLPLDSTTDQTSEGDSSYSDTTEDDTTDDQTVPSHLRFGPGYGFYNPNSGRQMDVTKVYDASNFQRINTGPADSFVKPMSAQDSASKLTSGTLNANVRNYDTVPEPPVRTDSSRSFVPMRQQTLQRADSGTNAPGLGVASHGSGPGPGMSGPPGTETESAREGPMPQVPSQPRNLQRADPGRGTPPRELPWPDGPPPPYTPTQKFVV